MSFKNIKSIAIIAGGGFLPLEIHRSCREKGIKSEIIAMQGDFTDNLYNGFSYCSFKAYEVSKILTYIKSLGIKHVIFAGKVRRGQLSQLVLDSKGRQLFGMIIKSGFSDNNILTTIIRFFEDEGLIIVHPKDVVEKVLIKKGNITSIRISKQAESDIIKGADILKSIGRFDIGQALIIQNGLVLGLEAAEGTDKLIERCRDLKQGSKNDLILIKICKPKQDERIDLPCIGVDTIINAGKSGIHGIALEAEKSLILNKEETLQEAEKLGIFIYGI